MARQSRGRVRNTSSGGSWGRRGGKEALEQAKQERKAAAARSNRGPREFWLEKGQTKTICILDDSLDDMFYVHRHDYYDPNSNTFTPPALCCRQIEECPICAEVDRNPKGAWKPAAFTIMSSIVEFTDPDEEDPIFTTKDGEEVFQQKTILAMKATQSEEFERIFSVVTEKHGTLRGLVLQVTRSEGKQSIRIGKPTMMDDGQMYYMLSEDEILDWFGHDAIKGDDGKTIKEADADTEPFDYSKLFPEPNAEDLADTHGLPLAPGSDADNRRSRRGDDDEDDAPRTRSRGRKRSRGGASDEDEEQPTRRSRGRRRTRSQEDDQDEDQREDDQEDAGEEEEKPRTRTRTRTRTRSRSDEQEEDSPPKRSRTRGRSRGRAASADDAEIPM